MPFGSSCSSVGITAGKSCRAKRIGGSVGFEKGERPAGGVGKPTRDGSISISSVYICNKCVYTAKENVKICKETC